MYLNSIIFKNKKIFAEITPPIVFKKIQQYWNASKTFNNYQLALKHADSYEAEEIVKVVVAKGVEFKNSLLEKHILDSGALRISLAILTSIKTDKIRVLDFGGAAGVHYFLTRFLLDSSIKLDWRVVETKAMVSEIKNYKLENKELEFFDTIDKATKNEKFDLVFSSSTLQYVPDPYATLQKLCEIDTQTIAITRTPITERPVVILQKSLLSSNGIGAIPKNLNIKDKIITYPATMIDKTKIEEIFTKFGYIKTKIKEEENVFSTRKNRYCFWGYVIRRHRSGKRL